MSPGVNGRGPGGPGVVGGAELGGDYGILRGTGGALAGAGEARKRLGGSVKGSWVGWR